MSQTARLSEAQYLERELAAETRHEYVDGQLQEVSGVHQMPQCAALRVTGAELETRRGLQAST